MAHCKKILKRLHRSRAPYGVTFWSLLGCAGLLCVWITGPLFAGPLEVHYDWQTGKFTVTSANTRPDLSKDRVRRQLLALLPPNLMQPMWPAGGDPQMTPTGLTQVSLAAFDPVNNALRIRAGVTPPGGQASPSDADQVFSSIFDSTYDAIRVNCVSGCGGSGGLPGGNNTAVQFNSSGSFGGDASNFYYNPITHSLGLTGGLTLGIPLPVTSGGTGTSTPAIVAGANISVNGAWPNQSVSLSGVIPASSIPTPTASTLGGVNSIAAVPHQWVNSISTAGVAGLSQPGFSDLSGTATMLQLPTTLAQFSGTIVANDCAKWTATGFLADAGAACGSGSTLPGGANTAVQFNSSGSFGGDTSNFYYNTATHSLGLTGGLTLGSPLPVASGGTGTTAPALVGGANISISGVWPNQTVAFSGVIPAASLPTPTATTLGGVESTAAVTHEWVNSISTSGAPSLSQPAFTDISGIVSPSQLPAPTAATLGGIESAAAVANEWINAISTSGVPSFSQPGFANLSGTATLAQLPSSLAQFTGTITSNDCAKWSSSGVLSDAGAVCGGAPGGSTTQYQFNNAGVFGGAVPTYNATTAESTFPNVNNVYYVDGVKYSTVEAVIADPNFKGGTIISTIPETFSGPIFQTSYPQQVFLWGANNAFLWQTNVHINVPPGDKLIGQGDKTTIQIGSGFPPQITVAAPTPVLTANTTGGTIPASDYVNVVITLANGNGETVQSAAAQVQVSTGSTNSVTVTAPGAQTNATSYNVYACISATSGCTQFQLSSSGNALTVSASITAAPSSSLAPPTVNTSENVISLASNNAGVGSANEYTRVENLMIDCNGAAGAVGAFNNAAQENSGFFGVRFHSCEQEALDIEGSGAQNSSYNHIQVAGNSLATSIGVRVYGAPIRGMNDVTIAPIPGQPQGVAALEIINPVSTPGVSSTCYRDLHIEDYADGVLTESAPACVENVTGNSTVGNLVHFDSGSLSDTAILVKPGGATNAIQDDVFAYSSGNNEVGFYSIGSGTGTARPRITSAPSTSSNFQNGLTVAGNPVYGFTGTLTAGDCVKLGTTTTLADAGAACGSGGSTNFPLTVSGTVNSGGIPYFNSATQESSSALLPAGNFVLGGGAGAPPTASFSIVPIANGGTGASTLAAASIPIQTGTITAGDCVKWASGTSITDAGAACGSGGGVTWAGDLAGSTNTTQTVVGLHFGTTATPLSTTAPTTGQVLEWNGTNIVGATNSPTGALVQAPAAAATNTVTPTADIVGLTINPFSSTQTSDLFDICVYGGCASGKYLYIDSSGNVHASGTIYASTFSSSGAGPTSIDMVTGNLVPGATGQTRLGSFSGNIPSVSENGAAFQPLLTGAVGSTSSATNTGYLVAVTGSGAVGVPSLGTSAGYLGPIVINAGASGNSVGIATAGEAGCQFDFGATAGDYVEPSAGIAGECHDVTQPPFVTVTQTAGTSGIPTTDYYWVALTYYDGTHETVIGNTASGQLSGTNSGLSVSIPPFGDNAGQVKIYAAVNTTATEPALTLQTTVNVGTGPYALNSVTTTGANPPKTNTIPNRTPTDSQLMGLAMTGGSGAAIYQVSLSPNVIPSSGSAGGGSGTVTSVALSLPSIFTVTGSPVTTVGTLTGSLAVQSPNLIFAGPSGGSTAGLPTFRNLVAADLAPSPVSGDCVQTNGSTLAWVACGGSGGSSSWSSLTNPTANLALSMGADTTTFSWSNTALGQFGWDANGDVTLGTAATTAITNSPILNLTGEYQSGTSTFAPDTISIKNGPSPSTNGVDTLSISHSGSPGGYQIQLNGPQAILAVGTAVTAGSIASNTYSTASGADPISTQESLEITAGAAVKESFGIKLKATAAALTAGELVCVDTANANSIIVCPTTTTNQFIGFVPSAISLGSAGEVAIEGQIINAISDGSVACALGNYVLASSTIAGDVKCSTTAPSNGTQVGFAMTTAAATAGTAFTVLIDKR
jgi:hypothetical protein